MTKTETRRAEEEKPLAERILDELAEAGVARGKPLVAVDADEVLVHFAEHFSVFCGGRGYRFELTEYRLETALKHEDGAPLTQDEITPLIWSFIEEETGRQPMIEGAAAALESLTRDAQIIILTNAPYAVRAARIANLSGHGMNYPVVMNEGGKGRALSWLAARADAPVAFIDDSAIQHESAAKRAPGVTRLHLVGSEMLKPIIGRAETAQAHPEDWREAEEMIRRALGKGL